MEEIKVTDDLISDNRKGIQPYKLNCMMKTAAKVTDMLTKIPEFMVTYDDIEFILDIVQAAVKRAKATRNDSNKPNQ